MEYLGGYEIREKLGSDLLGDVYLALSLTQKRSVILKGLAPLHVEDEAGMQCFHQETQALIGLKHPHIAGLLELGQEEGRLFLVFETLHGPTLESRLAGEGALGWDEALQITRGVGAAPAFAHAEGLVHADVKPRNILLSEVAGMVLTNFGLWKLAAGRVWMRSRNEDYYDHSPDVNPMGPDPGRLKVLYGGSWNHLSSDLVVAIRGGFDPVTSWITMGFRCARSPKDALRGMQYRWSVI